MKGRGRHWFGVATAAAILMLAMAFVLTHPPVTLIFKVWNAVPGSVTDSDGRLGRVYQAPHGTRAIVVFNKGEGPRPNGPLDLVFPHPETKTVFMQCTVNPRTLFAGDYKSDEIFRDFLLSRIDGDGWASDAGGIATVKPEGHPNTYVLTNYERRQVPDGYTVKFHVGS